MASLKNVNRKSQHSIATVIGEGGMRGPLLKVFTVTAMSQKLSVTDLAGDPPTAGEYLSSASLFDVQTGPSLLILILKPGALLELHEHRLQPSALPRLHVLRSSSSSTRASINILSSIFLITLSVSLISLMFALAVPASSSTRCTFHQNSQAPIL